MAFGVADKKMLGGVKAGDKVKFHVEMLKNGRMRKQLVCEGRTEDVLHYLVSLEAGTTG